MNRIILFLLISIFVVHAEGQKKTQSFNLNIFKPCDDNKYYKRIAMNNEVPINPTMSDVADATRKYLAEQGIDYKGDLKVLSRLKDGKNYFFYYFVDGFHDEMYINEDGEYYKEWEMPRPWVTTSHILRGNQVVVKEGVLSRIMKELKISSRPAFFVVPKDLDPRHCIN